VLCELGSLLGIDLTRPIGIGSPDTEFDA
jgi:hypothetical protein